MYANLDVAFQQVFWVGFYLTAMVILGLHLFHGTWSVFQSLGIDNPDRNRGLRRFAAVVAISIFLAFVSVPAAFFLGVMPKPEPTPHLAQHLEPQR